MRLGWCEVVIMWDGGAGGGMHARGMILNGGGGWAVMNGVPGRPGGGGTTRSYSIKEAAWADFLFSKKRSYPGVVQMVAKYT